MDIAARGPAYHHTLARVTSGCGLWSSGELFIVVSIFLREGLQQ